MTTLLLAAKPKHSPTRAMQVVAKRGIKQAAGNTKIDPVAVSVGRKVASGQQLSHDHVEAMASYHAGHDGPCTSSVSDNSTEDMLWGGAPGASWSASRCAAVDVSALGEEDVPTILTLDEEGAGVALEIFVRDGMGEPIMLDEENQNLIWAPILRSGMLATRPGPNGEKLKEPLVFVPGTASDPRKEIGIQNLYDAFHANAIQHVTVPTSHDNDVLSNTGFIVDMKIVDSKKRPGEVVLMGGHDIREPDVKRKMELGTIANRSCGILYDYTNTETGNTYDQVVEHVALTNKPWVTGMAAYGEFGEDDLSEHRVVPMLLSEAPREKEDLADKTDNAWDGSASRFTDQQYASSCVLDRGTGTPKQRYSLPIKEPDGTLNANAVESAAGMISKIKGASLAQKKAAARKLISAYKTIGKLPSPLILKLVAASTKMSEAERRQDLLLADVQWGDEPSLNQIRGQILSQLDGFRAMGQPGGYPYYYVMDVTPNKALVQIEYGDPDGADDAWVVPFEADTDGVRLSDFSEWTPVEKAWITDDDADRDKQELATVLQGNDFAGELPVPISALSRREEAVLQLSQERPTNQQGGAMTPTTAEVLERLGLSDEQKSVFQTLATQTEQLRTQLSEVTKASREEKIVARVKELQGRNFSPGFCKRYEEIALGDDGLVAAKLNLSENGTATGAKEYTATEIADSLIACLPVDDSGKLALADQANLLTSPIADRPPVDAADQAKVEEKQDGTKPQSTEDWLAEAEKVAPGVTSGLRLSTDTTKKEG